jgi:mono/diheme cytochrome c family protein
MRSARGGGAYAAAVIAISAVLIGCGGDDGSETVGAGTTATAGTPQPPDQEQPLSPAEEHGRELFIQNCGSCHTLDAAGTDGDIGPNLGELQLDEADVQNAIERGGTGTGNMPQNLVTGQDAADVAAFVAASGSGPSP